MMQVASALVAAALLASPAPRSTRKAACTSLAKSVTKPAFQLHKTLRDRLGVPMPTGQTVVAVYAAGRHHEFVSISLVATRDSEGRWTVDRLIETTWDDSLRTPPEHHRTVEALDATRAKELEVMLADPCLLAWEPPANPVYPGVGARSGNVEIVDGRQSGTLPAGANGSALANRIWELLS